MYFSISVGMVKFGGVLQRSMLCNIFGKKKNANVLIFVLWYGTVRGPCTGSPGRG